MHRAIRTGGLHHRFEIATQLLQTVVAQPFRHLGCTAATHIISDDPVVGGQLADQWPPDLVIVRITMHQQQGWGVSLFPDIGTQAQAVAIHVQLSR